MPFKGDPGTLHKQVGLRNFNLPNEWCATTEDFTWSHQKKLGRTSNTIYGTSEHRRLANPEIQNNLRI